MMLCAGAVGLLYSISCPTASLAHDRNITPSLDTLQSSLSHTLTCICLHRSYRDGDASNLCRCAPSQAAAQRSGPRRRQLLAVRPCSDTERAVYHGTNMLYDDDRSAERARCCHEGEEGDIHHRAHVALYQHEDKMPNTRADAEVGAGPETQARASNS